MMASSGRQVTVREIVEARGDEFPPEIRAPLEAEMARDEMGPKVGEVPPDFYLKMRGAEARVRLSSYRRKRPVALVFGSYT